MNLLQVAGERDDVRAVYQALSRVEYSWEELTSRPLPPGVDPARIELYLSDSAFQVRQSDLNAGSPQMQGFGSGSGSGFRGLLDSESGSRFLKQDLKC